MELVDGFPDLLRRRAFALRLQFPGHLVELRRVVLIVLEHVIQQCCHLVAGYFLAMRVGMSFMLMPGMSAAASAVTCAARVLRMPVAMTLLSLMDVVVLILVSMLVTVRMCVFVSVCMRMFMLMRMRAEIAVFILNQMHI